MSSTHTRAVITPAQPRTMEDVFTRGDCWALAIALADRYNDLTVCVLGEEVDDHEFGWIHMLVRDDRDPAGNTLVDIRGARTLHQVLDEWDDWPDWEDVYPLDAEATEYAVRGLSRRYPDVAVEAGIAHLLASGWTPSSPVCESTS